METRRLTRDERLRLRKDFKNVFKNGKSVYNEYFRIVYVKNELGLTRIAVLVKKKIGKAVYRNRIKRLVKEFFRNNKRLFPESSDIVFLARGGFKGKESVNYKDVERVILDLLERIK
ncbi:MAG: ribonuclease P protein component [Thermotogaceae bacterium]|nr:ribonuclease P protein component [Thermotogaceae bacterium]